MGFLKRGKAMTVSTSTNKFRYEGNGVTDTFAFSGRIFNQTDLVVEIILRSDDSLVETLTITTDYTVTINSPESASVTVASGKIPSSLQDIQLRRSLTQTQTLDLPTGTVFPAVSVENALDRNISVTQDLVEQVNRTIRLPATSSLSEISLTTPTANSLIGWNAAGDGLTNYSFAILLSAIDTNLTGLSDGDVLAYNLSAELFEPTALVDLTGSNNTFTGTNVFQGVVDVTNVNAEGSGGGNLRTNGGTNCLSWGGGGSANLTAGGNLSMSTTHKIVNMADPTADQDAATKKYVDDEIAANVYVPDTLAKGILTVGGTTFRANSGFASVVRNASGIYTFTMTDAAPNTNYLILALGSRTNAAATGAVVSESHSSEFTRTTTSFQLRISGTSGTVDIGESLYVEVKSV